uniref:Uncharacterized protein n=1 Tax=Sphaerodactylus townsendi TaxID=933632 RepID=A0ACB8FRB0_9SAUR
MYDWPKVIEKVVYGRAEILTWIPWLLVSHFSHYTTLAQKSVLSICETTLTQQRSPRMHTLSRDGQAPSSLLTYSFRTTVFGAFWELKFPKAPNTVAWNEYVSTEDVRTEVPRTLSCCGGRG